MAEFDGVVLDVNGAYETTLTLGFYPQLGVWFLGENSRGEESVNTYFMYFSGERKTLIDKYREELARLKLSSEYLEASLQSRLRRSYESWSANRGIGVYLPDMDPKKLRVPPHGISMHRSFLPYIDRLMNESYTLDQVIENLGKEGGIEYANADDDGLLNGYELMNRVLPICLIVKDNEILIVDRPKIWWLPDDLLGFTSQEEVRIIDCSGYSGLGWRGKPTALEGEIQTRLEELYLKKVTHGKSKADSKIKIDDAYHTIFSTWDSKIVEGLYAMGIYDHKGRVSDGVYHLTVLPMRWLSQESTTSP